MTEFVEQHWKSTYFTALQMKVLGMQKIVNIYGKQDVK
jgi:hypothetical protein